MPIYFIQIGDKGAVKIGKAKDPEMRRLTIQTYNPYPLKIIRTFSGGVATERWFQHHFLEEKIHGEWFSFKQEMLTINAPKDCEKINAKKKSHYLKSQSNERPNHPIARWLTKTGMTYSEFGRLIDRSGGCIRNYIRGHRDPSLKILGLMYLVTNGEIDPLEVTMGTSRAMLKAHRKTFTSNLSNS